MAERIPKEEVELLKEAGLPATYERWYLWRVWSRKLIDLYNDVIDTYSKPTEEKIEDVESRYSDFMEKISYRTPEEFREKFPYSTLYWVRIHPSDYERADKRTFRRFAPLLPEDTFADVLAKIRIILDSFFCKFKFVRSYSTSDKRFPDGTRDIEMQLIGFCLRKDVWRVEDIGSKLFDMLEDHPDLEFLKHIPYNEPGIEVEVVEKFEKLTWTLKVYDHDYDFDRVYEEREMPENWVELSDEEILEIFSDFEVMVYRGKRGVIGKEKPLEEF